MISAGEASGDMHAAHALAELQAQGVQFTSFGMGADKLAATGMELVLDCRELAVIGIVDVLINYPKFLKRLELLRQSLRQRRPDLLIIVDYPDFNLKLAETAREIGVPVLFYISPQVWAWRHKRIQRIGSLVAHMAVLFPFEVDVYQQAGIPVTYVGHPLVDTAVCEHTQAQARELHALAADNTLVALLPGSRNGEARRNLPLMLQTAALLQSRLPGCRFVLPRASTLDAGKVDALLAASAVQVSLLDGHACDAMCAADVVLTASGTATLETAMIGTPMVIMYVVNPINYAIMKRLIRIDDIGLVNIVAGKRIAAEFVQHAATPEAMAEALVGLLNDEDARSRMLEELASVREKMGSGGASARVAKLILELASS